MFLIDKLINQSNRSRRGPKLSPRRVDLLREAFWFIDGVVLLYLVLIFASYTRSDPGWSFSGSGGPVLNKGGAFGAWLADLAFYLFGVSAWIFVLAALAGVISGFRRLMQGVEPDETVLLQRRGTWVAVLGFVLLLLMCSAIEALRLYRHGVDLPLQAGGLVGAAVAEGLAQALGFNGGTLVMLVLAAAGWSLFSGMSWLGLAETLGGALEKTIALVQRRLAERADRRQGEVTAQEREFVVAEAKLEFTDRPPIVVVPPVTEIRESDRVFREKQAPLFQDMPDSPLPPLHLLEAAGGAVEVLSHETLEFTSRLIERKLADFGVAVKVVAAYPGPVITRYEIEPAVGVKGAQIINLVKDLARALGVVSIRVVETIPGKTCMGLEIPNPKRQVVKLVEILSSRLYADTASPLTLVLGKDIAGNPAVADLSKMPHLLVAGTTGSGKSVAINAMILSLLYKAEPRQVRLLMVDPKMLELSVYEGIPHLLAPVVTDMKLAGNALNWSVAEMERRYKLMSTLGVRNLSGYNQKLAEAKKAKQPLTNPFSLTPESPEPLEELPFIVVVIDELADLMMVQGKKIEELIARLAQKARAAGIHLILATQRPSVDVITGLIKANIPSRIAFQVSSKIDSRTILDQMGAEALLGQGDMLYLPPGTGYPQRVHGAFVSDAEVHKVVGYLKEQGGPQYIDGVLEAAEGPDTEGGGEGGEGASGEADPMYDQAVAVVLKSRRASISLVQRHLRIGYNRAARLIEQMERAGLVSAMHSNGNRDVLVPARENQ